MCCGEMLLSLPPSVVEGKKSDYARFPLPPPRSQHSAQLGCTTVRRGLAMVGADLFSTHLRATAGF